MSDYERDWFGVPRPQPPGPRVTENDNAGRQNTLSLYEQLLYDKSPGLGGMTNWGQKGDPYGMRMPDYYPPPPGNDQGRPSGKILPFKPVSMEVDGDPDAGILAKGKPLITPRSRGGGADLPSAPPGSAYQKRADQYFAQERQHGLDRFEELKRDYPYGAGYPENSPSFPSGTPDEAPKASHLALQGQKYGGGYDEDVGKWTPHPMPPEFEPARPIPLGEIQRRWGVPRLENM